jgi:hypothetical protein
MTSETGGAPHRRTASCALLCALALGLAAGPASADVAAAIELAVARSIGERGTAGGLGVSALPADLVGRPLERALADALIARADGRTAAARRTIEQALAELESGAIEQPEPAVEAALLELLLEVAPPAAAGGLAAGSERVLFELAHAMHLAAADRCRQAGPILARRLGDVPASAAAARLGARALVTCGRADDALGWLWSQTPAGVGPVDPALAAAAGEILLQIGDHAAASRWCGEAAQRFEQASPRRHGAAACAAAADALRGLMPAALVRWVEARQAQSDDRAVAPDRRVFAGMAAAWAAAWASDPALARQALAILDRLEALPLDGVQVGEMRGLRAIALARLDRTEAAEAVLARAQPGQETDAAGRALYDVARAELLLRQGDAQAARAAAVRAEQMAREVGAVGLAAQAALSVARVDALGDATVASVLEQVEGGLRRWSPAVLTDERPFDDPAFPRRAAELVIDSGWVESEDRQLLSGRLVTQAQQLLDVIAGAGRTAAVPEVEDVRRYLAARGAALLLCLVGETRTFAWLVEPGGLRAEELPAGSALHDALVARGVGPWRGDVLDPDAARQLVRQLHPALGAEARLLVVPDGFLLELPWSSAFAAGREPGAGAPLPAILPGLTGVTRPPLPVARQVQELSFIGLFPPRAGEVAGNFAGLGPLASFRMVSVTGEPEPGALLGGAQARRVLHLGLPLLAGGAGPQQVLFALRDREQLAREPRVLPLSRILAAPRGVELVALAPRHGWAAGPASAVHAAGASIDQGVRSAIVAVPPAGVTLAADEPWRQLYAEIARGRTLSHAVAATLARRGTPLHLQLVGEADIALLVPVSREWPFWTALGAAGVVVVLALWLALRRPRDPFQIEPPEETG